MAKKHIITIAGPPGSGKSSTAKSLAAKLEYRHFSSGDLFRMLARERNIDVLQANLKAEVDAELDHLVDARLQEIGETDDGLVIDSRTAWHWIPGSYKVFLDLDLQVAAERILSEKDTARSRHEHIHGEVEQYADALKHRLASESKRYKNLYDIDPYNLENYDLVVDTASRDLDATVAYILERYKAWIDQQ